VVSQDKKSKRGDYDILRCRADILRARDIIPSEPPPPKEPSRPSAETMNKKEPLKVSQQQTNVPKFDLAEEIMAEQRKITAIKRKAPDKKMELDQPQIQPVGYAIEQLGQTLAEQDQIIAEIVARDIERLCRGEYSSNSE